MADPSNNREQRMAEDRVNILIVDDRQDKLLALRSIVEGVGENIVCAYSGREALRCLLNEDFAVILLDVNMPGMDGFETASLIRQRPRTEHTPIIFISAVNDAETHVSRGYSLGAVDYILTPIVPEVLRAKITVFVDLFRKTQQVKRQAEERLRLVQEQAARAEAEAARERAAFLAEASNVLARSLEYEATFSALAQLVVPRLADCCIIDMIDDSGIVQPVTVVHRNPAIEPVVEEFRRRYPLEIEDDSPVAGRLRRGMIELCPRLNEAKLREIAPEEDKRRAIEQLHIFGYIAVPLSVRGRFVGALTIFSNTDRHYGESEASLMQELGQRAAMALENAGLYKAAQKAREEAERANRAKDKFLAMLSHELRTPLTPVLTTVTSITYDSEFPDAYRPMMEMIRRNVQLESRLIDDLLDLTRISKGKVQLNIEDVDGHALLRNAIEICEGDLTAKSLRVHEKFEAGNSALRGDSARLQQVFWNLIKNAVKFSEPGSDVWLNTREAEGQLEVEVRDAGHGIEPELLPRIFDAFEQGDRASSTGLGLGLAITKALVELHGGSITAESDGRGRGASFRVFLPLAANVGTSNDAAVAGAANGSWIPLRILLVDDHEDTNQSLTRLLSKRGYDVRCARDVHSALDLAREYSFDVLMSDMGLPDGTGVDLIRQLQEIRPVRAIALSGYGMEDDFQRSKAAGFSEHLVKPIDVNSLDAVLQEVGRKPLPTQSDHGLAEA
jgi:signal transduction histidine kinase/DNA-binding response OmpR family regulator